MFVESLEPTFKQKRDETEPTLHLAAAESLFPPKKGNFSSILKRNWIEHNATILAKVHLRRYGAVADVWLWS